MLLGGFGRIRDYKNIAKAGFDFTELDIPEIADLSQDELEEFKKDIRQFIKVPIASRLLPVSEPLFFTKGFRPESLRTYLENTCEKTAQLGISAIILGNGKARSFLCIEDRKKEDIFLETLQIMAEIAAKYNQELILEPLGPKYSNNINTISEAVEIIKKIRAKNLFTMADLRHMVGANDPFESITENIQFIHHLHIDYPLSYPQRLYPSADDNYDYSGFLNAIKNSGYLGTLTVEADIPSSWTDALKNIKSVLNA